MIQDLLVNLAVCYLSQGEIGKAKLLLREVEIHDDPYINYNLEVVYLEEGRYQEAIRRFDMCLDEEELAPDARMGFYAKMGRRKKALEQFEEVLKLEISDFERSNEVFEKAEELGFKSGGMSEFLKSE